MGRRARALAVAAALGGGAALGVLAAPGTAATAWRTCRAPNAGELGAVARLRARDIACREADGVLISALARPPARTVTVYGGRYRCRFTPMEGASVVRCARGGRQVLDALVEIF